MKELLLFEAGVPYTRWNKIAVEHKLRRYEYVRYYRTPTRQGSSVEHVYTLDRASLNALLIRWNYVGHCQSHLCDITYTYTEK